MLRLRDGQGTLWEEFLPPEVGMLSEELTAIDRLLDDDRVLERSARGWRATRGGRVSVWEALWHTDPGDAPRPRDEGCKASGPCPRPRCPPGGPRENRRPCPR